MPQAACPLLIRLLADCRSMQALSSSNMCAPADRPPTYLKMEQLPTTANLEMPSNTSKTCFEDADLRDIRDNLSTGLFWTTYTISESPADGHCFAHSVVTTFNANMSDSISVKLDVDVLSAKLSNETMANYHE